MCPTCSRRCHECERGVQALRQHLAHAIAEQACRVARQAGCSRGGGHGQAGIARLPPPGAPRILDCPGKGGLQEEKSRSGRARRKKSRSGWAKQNPGQGGLAKKNQGRAGYRKK